MTDKRVNWSKVLEMELRLLMMEMDLVLKEIKLERRS
jgi:hypothetical protein